MIRLPLPFEIPYSILCDANGNGQYIQNFGNDFYYAATISGTGSGNPVWTVNKNGVFLQPGLGPQVVMPASLCGPGTKLQIVVTNAAPSSTVSGLIYGTKASRAEDLPPQISTAQSQITSSTVYKRERLYPQGVVPKTDSQPSFQVAAAAVSPNLTFTLPPNTVSFELLANANGAVFDYQLIITGITTGQQYFGSATSPGSTAQVSSPTLPLNIRIAYNWDRQLLITVVGDAVNATSYFASALFAPESLGQGGDSQSVFSPTPAPWQAPTFNATFNVSIASGGNASLIAALSARAITFLHGYQFGTDGANAVGRITEQWQFGANILDMDCNATRGQIAVGSHYGLPSPVGAGVTVTNNGAAASFIAASQSYNVGI